MFTFFQCSRNSEWNLFKLELHSMISCHWINGCIVCNEIIFKIDRKSRIKILQCSLETRMSNVFILSKNMLFHFCFCRNGLITWISFFMKFLKKEFFVRKRNKVREIERRRKVHFLNLLHYLNLHLLWFYLCLNATTFNSDEWKKNISYARYMQNFHFETKTNIFIHLAV